MDSTRQCFNRLLIRPEYKSCLGIKVREGKKKKKNSRQRQANHKRQKTRFKLAQTKNDHVLHIFEESNSRGSVVSESIPRVGGLKADDEIQLKISSGPSPSFSPFPSSNCPSSSSSPPLSRSRTRIDEPRTTRSSTDSLDEDKGKEGPYSQARIATVDLSFD